MIDRDTRTAILRLAAEGHGPREIARIIKISRNAVRRVLRSGRAEVPDIVRQSIAADHIQRIRELYTMCQGNLARVHEELRTAGVEIAYSTLTTFCRELGIGQKPKQAAGRYDFAPGEEMQHDTSPHLITIGGRSRLMQCAALALCYSRMLFSQVYPTFNRFLCKTFLTDALVYFEGAAAQCMYDCVPRHTIELVWPSRLRGRPNDFCEVSVTTASATAHEDASAFAGRITSVLRLSCWSGTSRALLRSIAFDRRGSRIRSTNTSNGLPGVGTPHGMSSDVFRYWCSSVSLRGPPARKGSISSTLTSSRS